VRLGLLISVLMHAALLAWALVSIAETREVTPPKIEPIVTEVISASDLAKLRQGSRTAKLDDAQAKEVPKPDEAKQEPPKPKPVAAPPPPAAEPPPAPLEEPKPPEPVKAAEPPPPKAPEPPKPEPDKQALDQKLEELAMLQAAEDKARAENEARALAAAEAKARAEAEARKKAEEKKKRELAEAKRKAEEKRKADQLAKQKLDTDRLSALLDKTPDPKQAPAAAPPPAAPTKNVGPVRGGRDGRDAQNAANEASLLLAIIISRIRDQGCWNIQAGGELAANQVPKIQFELNPDGTVRGEPRVLNPQSSPQFQLAADAAKSAVLKCHPYPLPADKYQMWRKVTLDFDPRELFQ